MRQKEASHYFNTRVDEIKAYVRQRSPNDRRESLRDHIDGHRDVGSGLQVVKWRVANPSIELLRAITHSFSDLCSEVHNLGQGRDESIDIKKPAMETVRTINS